MRSIAARLLRNAFWRIGGRSTMQGTFDRYTPGGSHLVESLQSCRTTRAEKKVTKRTMLDDIPVRVDRQIREMTTRPCGLCDLAVVRLDGASPAFFAARLQ